MELQVPGRSSGSGRVGSGALGDGATLRTMSTLFVTNPKSGRRNRPDVIESAIRQACGSRGIDFEIRPWREVEEIDEIVSEGLERGFRTICAVGGDGTASQIGSRLIGTEAALAILPTGSGNGLARHLHIPMNPVRAAGIVLEGRIERIDTARVNETPFLGVCGIGFDAEIAFRFASSRIRGLQTYIIEGAKVWRRYRCQQYALDVDGETIDAEAFLVAIANSGQYGNEARIAPSASLTDGRLDVTLMKEPALLQSPALLVRLFTGTLRDSDRVRMLQGSSVVIRRDEAGPAHVDGEPIQLPAELRFEVLPLSLRVVVPPKMKRF